MNKTSSSILSSIILPSINSAKRSILTKEKFPNTEFISNKEARNRVEDMALPDYLTKLVVSLPKAVAMRKRYEDNKRDWVQTQFGRRFDYDKVKREYPDIIHKKEIEFDKLLTESPTRTDQILEQMRLQNDLIKAQYEEERYKNLTPTEKFLNKNFDKATRKIERTIQQAGTGVAEGLTGVPIETYGTPEDVVEKFARAGGALAGALGGVALVGEATSPIIKTSNVARLLNNTKNVETITGLLKTGADFTLLGQAQNVLKNKKFVESLKDIPVDFMSGIGFGLMGKSISKLPLRMQPLVEAGAWTAIAKANGAPTDEAIIQGILMGGLRAFGLSPAKSTVDTIIKRARKELGIKEGASIEEINNAYIKKLKKVDPESRDHFNLEVSRIALTHPESVDRVLTSFKEKRFVFYGDRIEKNIRPGIEEPALIDNEIIKFKTPEDFTPLKFTPEELSDPKKALLKTENWVIENTYDLNNIEIGQPTLLSRVGEKIYDVIGYRRLIETLDKSRIQLANRLIEADGIPGYTVKALRTVFPRITETPELQLAFGKVVGVKSFYGREMPKLIMEKINKDLTLEEKSQIGNALLGRLNLEKLNLNLVPRYESARSLLDFIHELNYQNGFLSKKQYEVGKGNYAPYLYKDIEVGDFFGKKPMSAISLADNTRLKTKSFKSRKITRELNAEQRKSLEKLRKAASKSEVRIRNLQKISDLIKKGINHKEKRYKDKVLSLNNKRDILYELGLRSKAVSVLAKERSFLNSLEVDIRKGQRDIGSILKKIQKEKEQLEEKYKKIFSDYDIRVQDAYVKQYNREQYLGGLITDPGYMVQVRLGEALYNNAIKEFSEQIKGTNFVSEVKKSGYTKLPDSKAYGDLKGQYVRNDVAEAMMGSVVLIPESIRNVVAAYDNFAGKVKASKLVFSPSSIGANIAGNHLFAFLNGIPLYKLEKAIPFAIQDYMKKGKIWAELGKHGELGTDIVSEEFTRFIKENKSTIESHGLLPTLWDKAKASTKIYGAVDDVYKIAVYKVLREQGLDVNETLTRLSESSQNYKKVGKAFDWLSRGAAPLAFVPGVGRFAGSFVKFLPELLRITKNGIKRNPAKAVGFLFGIQMLAHYASILSGETEEEKKIREGAKFFKKITLPLIGEIPFQIRVGNKEIDFSKMLPFFEVQDLINSEPMSSDYAVRKELADRLSKDVVLSPILQLAWNTDFTGNPIYNPATSLKTKLEDIGRFLFYSYAPRPIPELGRGMRVIEGKPVSRGGKTMTIPDWLVYFFTPAKMRSYGKTEKAKDIYYREMGLKWALHDLDSQIKDTKNNELLTVDERIKRIKEIQESKIDLIKQYHND